MNIHHRRKELTVRQTNLAEERLAGCDSLSGGLLVGVVIGLT
jgi:hypothetical protein